MEEILKQILAKLDNISDRIDMHDRSNKEEFKQINNALNGITEAVAKTMEDVTELSANIEKQEVEIKVIKGGKAQ